MERLEKCLNNITRNAIQEGAYGKPQALVYYGFNIYSRTVEHIHSIVMAIKEDFPDVSITEMEIYEITRTQSDRRAGHTMVSFYADTQVVKSKLKEFSVL